MAPNIEKLLDGFILAEGPHWDEKRQCLYFVDMTESTIHRYMPSTKKHTKVTIGDPNISIVIPVKDRKNEFVITLDRAIALIHWDGENDTAKIIKKLCEVEHGTNHVFNDGKCDKTGRLWTGTISTKVNSTAALVDKQCTLYSFQNNIIKRHRSEVGISNGIAFDYSINKMYYIDTFRYCIDQYDIDFETGTLSNQTTIFTKEKHGFPEDCGLDGMSIDTDGNLWVAGFSASSVWQINPRIPETIIKTIKFPAEQITSVTFGGPNLDELYVTSANVRDRSVGESPGSLFRVTGLNVKGFPADEAVI